MRVRKYIKSYLTMTELKKFMDNLEFNEIMDLLLKEEDLELDEIILNNNFHEFETEDDFFEEKQRLDKKIMDLRVEIKKLTVAARGRNWRKIIADDRDYINISGVKIFTPQEIYADIYGEVNHSRYRLENNTIYKLYFDLFRFHRDDKPTLSFTLARALE